MGNGVAVGDTEGAGVADGLATGVGLELAGAVHAPATNAAVTSSTQVFIGLDVRARALWPPEWVPERIGWSFTLYAWTGRE